MTKPSRQPAKRTAHIILSYVLEAVAEVRVQTDARLRAYAGAARTCRHLAPVTDEPEAVHDTATQSYEFPSDDADMDTICAFIDQQIEYVARQLKRHGREIGDDAPSDAQGDGGPPGDPTSAGED